MTTLKDLLLDIAMEVKQGTEDGTLVSEKQIEELVDVYVSEIIRKLIE